MKQITEYLLGNTNNKITSGIKIPKDIKFYETNISGENIIEDILYNFYKLFSKEDVREAFKNYENTEFNMICWYSKSDNAKYCEDLLNEMFPDGYERNYYAYKDAADLYSIVDEDKNVVIARFKSNDDRAIYIIDTGDAGYMYLCIEI